jgi:hypothetical protein
MLLSSFNVAVAGVAFAGAVCGCVALEGLAGGFAGCGAPDCGCGIGGMGGIPGILPGPLTTPPCANRVAAAAHAAKIKRIED